MSGSNNVNVPPVIWAQRKDRIFLKYLVENTVKPEIKIEASEIKFESDTVDKKHFKLDFQLFNEIDVEKSVVSAKARLVDITLKKKEDDTSFWPRLTKEKQVNHWLKVDFDKWIDEDEEENEKFDGDESFGDMLGGMGGLGGMAGMDGMKNVFSDYPMGGLGDGGDDDPLSDSDDDEDGKDLPSLESVDDETESKTLAAANATTETK